MLEIQNLQFHFRVPGSAHREILGDFSLSVEVGEWVSLTGPSGCGKTTLLRIISGLLNPSSGTVTWMGDPVASLLKKKSSPQIGLLFQDLALLDHLTASRNLKLVINQIHPEWSSSRVHQELMRFADLLGITDCLEQKVYLMSGGEKQRLAVARALIQKPDLLLLDEPLTSLDTFSRELVLGALLELKSQGAVTVIHMTHNLDEACLLGDRVGVMQLGRMTALAPPADLYLAPESSKVASMLGFPPMNLIPVLAISGLPTGFIEGTQCVNLGFYPDSHDGWKLIRTHAPESEPLGTHDKWVCVSVRYIRKQIYWGKWGHVLEIASTPEASRIVCLTAISEVCEPLPFSPGDNGILKIALSRLFRLN